MDEYDTKKTGANIYQCFCSPVQLYKHSEFFLLLLFQQSTIAYERRETIKITTDEVKRREEGTGGRGENRWARTLIPHKILLLGASEHQQSKSPLCRHVQSLVNSLGKFGDTNFESALDFFQNLLILVRGDQ